MGELNGLLFAAIYKGDKAEVARLVKREPGDWITEFGESGERYSYPPALNSTGFFEDFFDRKPKAVATFWRVVNRRLAAVGKVA
jgi:hypothetical protein